MESGKAHGLYLKYAPALAYVAVRAPDGTLGIGSAFHVGEGVFVTARHIVEGHEILEIATTAGGYVELSGEAAERARGFVIVEEKRIPVHFLSKQALRIRRGPYMHPEASADVAVFQVEEIDPLTPVVELGSHLDDWIGENDFTLSEAIVLGYPPIPMTTEPHLVAARAEVNAIVDLRHAPHVHFILSSMPRGGFSGGLAYSEWGFALGLVTNSLLGDQAPSELGFMAVLTVEPIYVCLAHHKLLPACQAEEWDDLWNSDHITFGHKESDLGVRVTGSLNVFNDGKRYHLTVMCDDDPDLLQQALEAAERSAVGCTVRQSKIRDGMLRLEFLADGGDPGRSLNSASEAAAACFEAAGRTRFPNI